MGAKRPEPVLTSANITATIAGLTSLLVTLGVLPATSVTQVNTMTEAVVAAVGLVVSTVPTLIHARVARKSVTPLTDPRNAAGEKLVPARPLPAAPSAPVAAPVAPAESTVDVDAVLAAADKIHPAAPADTVTNASPA